MQALHYRDGRFTVCAQRVTPGPHRRRVDLLHCCSHPCASNGPPEVTHNPKQPTAPSRSAHTPALYMSRLRPLSTRPPPRTTIITEGSPAVHYTSCASRGMPGVQLDSVQPIVYPDRCSDARTCCELLVRKTNKVPAGPKKSPNRRRASRAQPTRPAWLVVCLRHSYAACTTSPPDSAPTARTHASPPLHNGRFTVCAQRITPEPHRRRGRPPQLLFTAMRVKWPARGDPQPQSAQCTVP